jgi:hypothetical protein
MYCFLEIPKLSMLTPGRCIVLGTMLSEVPRRIGTTSARSRPGSEWKTVHSLPGLDLALVVPILRGTSDNMVPSTMQRPGAIAASEINKVKSAVVAVPVQDCQRWIVEVLAVLERKYLFRASSRYHQRIQRARPSHLPISQDEKAPSDYNSIAASEINKVKSAVVAVPVQDCQRWIVEVLAVLSYICFVHLVAIIRGSREQDPAIFQFPKTRKLHLSKVCCIFSLPLLTILSFL